MARRRRIGDALAGLGGARADLLEAAPGARSRFVALGGVLLSTGGLAVVSMSFAVAMALGVWVPLAVLIGLGWGFVVVNLDRMLLVGMAHDASVGRNLALAVPRLGLAMVLGVVIATPLTLQVFHKEIDTEIVTMQAEAADAYRASLTTDARFTGLPALTDKVTLERQIVATGGSADPALQPLQAAAAARQTDLDTAVSSQRDLQTRAQCELDGTCGTGAAGTGEAYLSARSAADAAAGAVVVAQAALTDATSTVTDAQARSLALAQAALPTDTAELDRLTSEQDRLQAGFDTTNASSAGLLLRLEALDRLSDSNTTLWAAKMMLSLLFMCVELLPVLIKLLLNFGPPTAYDELVALRDAGDLEVEQLQRAARIEVARAQEELLVMAEKERVDRQKALVLARKHAAVEAALAAQAQAQAQAEGRFLPDEPAFDDPLRALWDTGPIRLARSAARTVRTARRRPDVPVAG